MPSQVKGDGLKIHSRRSSGVQIPAPALFWLQFCANCGGKSLQSVECPQSAKDDVICVARKIPSMHLLTTVRTFFKHNQVDNS